MVSPGKQSKTIDGYISQSPKNFQNILEKFKQVIKESAPEAEEVINMGYLHLS